MPKLIIPTNIKDIDDNVSSTEEIEIIDVPINYDAKEKAWLYRIRILFLGLASLITAVIILAFVYHLIVSKNYHWLDTEGLNKIRELAIAIIVGLLMSISTTYFFKK